MNHDCNICNKISPHNGSICLGCGSPLARCKRPAVKKSVVQCPQPGCHSRNLKPVSFDESRLECQSCHAFFEMPDGYALDDRPEANAMKRERMVDRRLKPSADLWKGGRR